MFGQRLQVGTSVEILTTRNVAGKDFRNCLKFMDDTLYVDVVKQRVCKKLCGYPLCKEIIETTVDTKSYRTKDMDRKSYCKSYCYRTSKNIEVLIKCRVFSETGISYPLENPLDKSTHEKLQSYDGEATYEIEELCRKFEGLRIEEDDAIIESSNFDSSYLSDEDNFDEISVKPYKYGLTYKPCTEEENDRYNAKYNWKKIKGITRRATVEANESCCQTLKVIPNRKIVVPIRRANKVNGLKSRTKVEDGKQTCPDNAMSKPRRKIQ